MRPNQNQPRDGAGAGNSVGTTHRRKVAGMREWLIIDGGGQTAVVEAGKYATMRRTGLPARDLRVLDPMLSYPWTIMGRDRSIVVNLEHVKAIITAHEVLLLNFKDPFVGGFVEEFQRRIVGHQLAVKAQVLLFILSRNN